MVKKAKNAKNVTALLNTNFIKSVSVLNMFEISFWNSFQLFN